MINFVMCFLPEENVEKKEQGCPLFQLLSIFLWGHKV